MVKAQVDGVDEVVNHIKEIHRHIIEMTTPSIEFHYIIIHTNG